MYLFMETSHRFKSFNSLFRLRLLVLREELLVGLSLTLLPLSPLAPVVVVEVASLAPVVVVVVVVEVTSLAPVVVVVEVASLAPVVVVVVVVEATIFCLFLCLARFEGLCFLCSCCHAPAPLGGWSSYTQLPTYLGTPPLAPEPHPS